MVRAFSLSALFPSLLQPACAGAEPELMNDGNWLDPAPGSEAIKHLLAATKQNLVALPAGTFDMGDWGIKVNANGLPFDGTPDSKPLHSVTLSAFSIDKYPVTYVEFDVFTAAQRLARINQDQFSPKYRKQRNPAGVSWQGAKDYCHWLAQQTGEPYDLPTEAQWEYAARSGGKHSLYPTNNGESTPGVNTPTYEQRKTAGGLLEVGTYPANPAGIYDMGAGIREWTNDWYDAKYYETSPSRDPAGPTSGKAHVIRDFFGSEISAMTIKRWVRDDGVLSRTWTRFGTRQGEPDREIPYSKYSGLSGAAFRCVLNY